MLRNYLKIAARSLKERPVITAINVLGLAVGLAACLLIGLWVEQQLSYDTFHPEAENVYRWVNQRVLADTDEIGAVLKRHDLIIDPGGR